MTQVSWTRQLGLAAVLLALGTLAYWAEFKHKPEKEATEEQAKKLFSLEGTSIQSIRLGSPAHSDVVLNCLDLSSKLCKPGDPSKWQITEPVQLRADDSNVNTLISALNHLNSGDIISLKDESAEKRAALLKDYGLDPESRKVAKRIEVITEKGTTVLFVGGTHPIGDNTFAIEKKLTKGEPPSETVDDTQIYLIPNHFKANLEHDITYWRDKKLLTVASHEIESFQLVGRNGELSGNRKDHPWTLNSHSRDLPGDPDQINNLLNAAAGLSAKAFVSDHKTDESARTALHGASQVLTLTLWKEKGSAPQAPEPITLTLLQKKVGSEPSHLYAIVSNADPVFEIEPGSLNRLDKSPSDLRLSKLLTTLERFNVKRLEFSGKPIGPSPLILTQKEGKWTSEGANQDLDTSKVQNLLDRLSGTKVKEFLTGASTPKGDEEGLTVKTSDDKKSHTWIFWKTGSNLYARDTESHSGEVLLMDQSMAETLPWNRDFFYQPKPKAEGSPRPEKLKK